MAKSVSEHMHNEYILLKKVENKKKSVEFFKSNQIRKTLQSVKNNNFFLFSIIIENQL